MFMKLESYNRNTPKIKVFEKKVVLAVCRLENVKSVHDFMMNRQTCHGRKTASAVGMTCTDLLLGFK
jgi:hypothetical protein